MKFARTQLIILMLPAAALLAGCATNLPKGRPSMEYAEVTAFMQSETNTKGPNAYSRLEYLRSEDDYHVLQGSVSPAPIKFTPIGIDRYIFRVSDSGELPNFEGLSRVYGENSAFIRDFWGPDWQERQQRANRVAQGNLTPKLPHHRSYGSVSGGSEE